MGYSLTPSDIEEIKRFRGEGWTYFMIGEKFKITFQHAQAICKGKSRVYEPDESLLEEEWKIIPSLPCVLASNLGRLKRIETGRILKSYFGKRGFHVINLSFKGEKAAYSVHRLIAEAWLGPNEEMDVRHKDGNKNNNVVNNLEYVSYRVVIKDGKKKCSKCKRMKSLNEFHKDIQKKDGLYSSCAECHSATNVAGNRFDKEKTRKKNLMRKLKELGISLDEYNAMYKRQKGKCAICGKHEENFKYSLAIDHNHKSGLVRGLLCPKCNPGLGCFEDNIDLLKLAIMYLEKSNG